MLFRSVFGGITYVAPFFDNLKLIAEYDSERVNLGANLLFINHISVTAALCGLQSASIGICYKTTLTR